MNPFILRNDERLVDWKEFRKSLSVLPDEEKIILVARYWSQAPLQNIAYDIEDLKSLPTPWEMIYDGDWCRNSIAIGMEFTLRLSGIHESRMELRMIIDQTISDMMLALIVDGKFMLNYEWGTVREYVLPEDARTIKRFHHRKEGYVEF